MQSKRQLALALTKGLRGVQENLASTISDVKVGGQRLINYGSCLVPSDYYRNNCREMMKEDYRLLLSVSEIYARQDVVLEIYCKLRRI